VYLKFGKTAAAASAAVAGISEVALTASSNTAYEATITPTETTTAYIVFRGNNNTTPTMFVDLVDFVQIGCVSDYDLAFANPTQSLTVQDRAGSADGTCSSSGVSQVQPVVQLNSTSARIGTTAATPADGSIVASGQIKTLGGALATPSFAFEEEAGLGISRPTGNTLNFVTSSTERMRIGEQGHVLVGTTALDANVGAKKMQLEGSASTSVGPEMLLHNPAQGGGAASLLTFGGKASGTEGYTAAIKATNTGTLTIGTAHASGGFSEPAADLTISSTGLATFTRDSGSVIIANRTTNNGDAIAVRKDNYDRLRLGTEGITFPNGGNAPTAAAANQLDYYEEGTWTPVHAAAGSTSGTWNSTLTGTYTRIGDLVSVNLRITGTSMDFSSVSGYRGYSGLPFAPASDAAGSYDSFHTTSTIGTAAAFTTGSTLYLHPARIGTGTSVIFATVQYKV
jgi:hypothetical protein